MSEMGFQDFRVRMYGDAARIQVRAEQFALEPDEVTMDTDFDRDLGADSVDVVELVMAMEEEFEIGEVSEEELGTLKTVGDAVNYIAGKQK